MPLAGEHSRGEDEIFEAPNQDDLSSIGIPIADVSTGKVTDVHLGGIPSPDGWFAVSVDKLGQAIAGLSPDDQVWLRRDEQADVPEYAVQPNPEVALGRFSVLSGRVIVDENRMNFTVDGLEKDTPMGLFKIGKYFARNVGVFLSRDLLSWTIWRESYSPRIANTMEAQVSRLRELLGPEDLGRHLMSARASKLSGYILVEEISE
jgi:hypothetical protein